MSQFLETIRCCNGILENLDGHHARLNRTRRHFFGAKTDWDLAEQVQVPAGLLPNQVYRCRIIYGEKLESVEFIPYQIRPIHSLQLVQANDLDYAFKYANRSALDALRVGSSADEVLIVKNGLLTDTTYANVAFYDGSRWLTPAQPLLEGTRRAALLAAGVIHPEILRPQDLPRFQRARLFNALISWEEAPELTQFR
ncbi:MAG: aminotransferase class IV [Cytophagaceae bacterium]|nr:aminotransferase class IV [Cytophagaceae bacterium]